MASHCKGTINHGEKDLMAGAGGIRSRVIHRQEAAGHMASTGRKQQVTWHPQAGNNWSYDIHR